MYSTIPSQQLDPFGAGLPTGSASIADAFLGPQPQGARLDVAEKRKVATWTLPEDRRGKNLYLRDTVEDLIWTANQTWYTQRVLPWHPTDELHIQWTNLTANAHLMEQTPYLTGSSLVTQERQIRKASLVRRGIAAEFEHDFLRSPMGRVSFLAALGQMARSVQETANAEVIRALINAHHHQHAFLREAGIIREGDLKGYFDRDRSRFAICQKTKNGLEKLDMEVDKELYAYKGSAEAWILPEEVAIYATIVPSEKTDYWLAGQMGPDRVNNEGSKLLASALTTNPQDRVEPRRLVQGNPAFISRSFHVDNIGKMDLMSRIRQIGEYNTMVDECVNYKEYTSDMRNIAIYNEDIDDFSKITIQMAVENCNLFDTEGNLKPLLTNKRDGGDINDARRDFLSFVDPDSGQLSTAQYLYHIDPKYLTTEILKNAAVTMENFLSKNNFAVGNVVSTIRRLNNEPLAKQINDAEFQQLAALLRPFFTLGDVDDVRRVEDRDIFLEARVPVVARDEAVAGGDEPLESEIQSGFFEMLKAGVPGSKKDEIHELAFNDSASFEDRVEAIKNKYTEYSENKLKGFKLKNPASIGPYFEERLENYREALREAASSRPKTSSSTPKIAGYMKPGQDLSDTPYRYLYKGSERKSTGNIIADSYSTYRIAADKAFDESRGNTMGGGQRSRGISDRGIGMGLEGFGKVGIQYYGDRDTKQKIPDKDLRDMNSETWAKHLQNINNSGASYLHKLLMGVYARIPITRQAMLALIDHNMVLPLGFLLMRPHMQYKMRMAIKVGLDGKAGNTAIGNSNMQIQHEAGVKMAHMHYTTHMKAIVTNPKHVYVQPDVFSEEYQGGNGIRFYDREKYQQRDPENLKYSIICVAVPPNEKDFPVTMSASGRFYTEYKLGLVRKEDYEELHYSTAFRANAEFGFQRQIRKQAGDLPSRIASIVAENHIMHQGHQWMYNPKTMSFDRVRTNKGHWGKNVYAGVGEVRRGELKEMEKIDYTKYSTI